MIVDDANESYKLKTGEQRTDRVLTVLDRDPAGACKDTFEFVDPDLKPETPSLTNQFLDLVVRRIEPRLGGRIRARGTVLLESTES